jgi:TRAP-type C4-dicarboxylate transport system permease small subunit
MTAPPAQGAVSRAGLWLAFAGGAVLLATALLTTTSVIRRWLTSQPVQGDFELVSIGSGLAVFGFLALGARETLANGTTTMVLGLPTWWAVALGALGFAATSLAALLVALRLLQGRG